MKALLPTLAFLAALLAGASVNAAVIGTHVFRPALVAGFDPTELVKGNKARPGCNYLRGFKRRVSGSYC